MVNCSAIGRDCGLSPQTVQSYYEILEDTLVGLALQPWRASARKRLTGHPKFYLFDTGVTNAVNRRLTARMDPATRGRLFEQFVVLETHRRASYARSEVRLFYWRTKHGAEVDLVLEKHGRLLAGVEAKSGATVDGADCTGLRSFTEDHPGVPAIVVCCAPRPYTVGPVSVLPWREYLLRVGEWL
jgi:predicted AAA+ superfamily ATPase